MVGQYVGVGGSVVSHVNITGVRTEDGGAYACTAVNRAGSTAHQARLNVYGKALARPPVPPAARVPRRPFPPRSLEGQGRLREKGPEAFFPSG